MSKEASSNITQFGSIRSNVWPIFHYEFKKIVPMLVMFVFICFNGSVLRNLKDSLVITAKDSGAEVIPFIKVWVMFPSAVLSTILFTYLANKLSRQALFQVVLGTFVTFFALFGFVIYPLREHFHPHETADMLVQYLPVGLKGFIAMYRHWTLTCFYVMCELWNAIVLNVLFWGFANEITKIQEAPRFYSVLAIGSNMAAIVAGQAAVALSSNIFNPHLFFGESAWEQSFMKIVAAVVLSGIGALFSFRWIMKYVMPNPEFIPTEVLQKKKGKRLGFKESLTYLANSRYLIWIAILVISYNLVINLVEVLWKDRLRQLYPASHDYNVYVNNLTSAMGIISTSVSLVLAGIIRKAGWTFTALLTPIVLLTTTIAFFSCILFENTISPMASVLLGTTPLALAVFLGSVQNSFSKAAKYSLFDTTKEMAFIPLSSDHKLKGKAAIDGIGSRLGKSSGSVVHQSLLILFGSLSASAPYVAVILLAVIVIWISAVRSLGKEFSKCLEGIKEHPAGEPDTAVVLGATEKAPVS